MLDATEPSIVSPHEYRYESVRINEVYLLTTIFYKEPTISPYNRIFIFIQSPSLKLVHISKLFTTEEFTIIQICVWSSTIEMYYFPKVTVTAVV